MHTVIMFRIGTEARRSMQDGAGNMLRMEQGRGMPYVIIDKRINGLGSLMVSPDMPLKLDE